MAMLDVPVGQVIYQCLLQFGNNPFVSFEVSMTPDERKKQLSKLKREIKLLQAAINKKDPALARGVYSDKGLNWLCKDWPYLKKCELIGNATSSA